ncbi:MAG: hypothetical protein ACKOYM_00325 [Actinomycetes bacterium]
MQRDRAKKAKAAAKREKRLDKDPELIVGDVELPPEGEEIAPDVLLAMVAQLHEQFEAEEIDFDEFEERKTELFARLTVD